jgi:hypothetical protein
VLNLNRIASKRGLTLELSGAQRRGAVPAKRSITNGASRARRHAVARPLERPVRPRRAMPRARHTAQRYEELPVAVPWVRCIACAEPPLLPAKRRWPWRADLNLHSRALRTPHAHAHVTARRRCRGERPGASRVEPQPHCFQARPNVRVKRETPVWRLARDADDEPHCFAGQVPRRWLSA